MTSTATTPSSCSSSACATTPANDTVASVRPRYAVSSADGSYLVRVELPGVAKNDVSIDFDKSVLTIKGARKSSVPDTWKALHRELHEQGYVLRLKLNTPVDEDKLSAQLADGVLNLTLPLREAAKPRRIEVS